MTIWDYYRQTTNLLLTWNIANAVSGAVLMLRKGFVRGLGVQAVSWALINAAIALVARQATEQRLQRIENPYEPELMAKETDNIKWILLINTALDVIYMVGGLRLAETRGRRDDFMRGMGYGVILQGGLLFVWDVINVVLVPPKPEETD